MAKILLVDDSTLMRKMARKVLEEDGHWVIEADDGEKALVMAEKHRPDLIFLDVVMPKMDGWEVCKRIKASDKLGRTPIAMLTARGGERDMMESLQREADVHLTKPFTQNALLNTVNVLLGNRKVHISA